MKKNKRQLSKKSLMYVSLGTVLIFIMTFIGAGVFLRIIDIHVEGNYRYTAEEIIESSGISLGNNLLFLNIQDVVANIREANPFVNDVIITRMMPDEVLIEIVESTPMASVLVSEQTLIIDSVGRVLEKVSSGETGGIVDVWIASLIEVRGVEPERPELGNTITSTRLDGETRIQSMLEVLGSLERESIKENVVYIDVSNITNIHLGYLNIYRVNLGGLSQVRSNIARLGDAVDRIQSDHPGVSGVVNMTDATGHIEFRPNH